MIITTAKCCNEPRRGSNLAVVGRNEGVSGTTLNVKIY